MKQKTRIAYWVLPVVIFMFLVLAACTRPVPAPDVTATPENAAPVVMPTLAPATPLPDLAYPGTDGTQPTPDPNAPVEQPTAVPAGQPTSHTVQDGETLDSISQQYGVSPEEIAAANNLTTPSALVTGQVLVIPAPAAVVAAEPTAAPAQPEQPAPATGEQVHVVQPGENLFRISLAYGKTVAEVAAYNGIANPNFIYPGQVIRIP